MKLDVTAFAGLCDCGRVHDLAVRDIWIESGALARLPGLMQAWERPVMICDQNTYEAAGRQVEALLPGLDVICLDPEGLHADERAVAEVERNLSQEAQVLLAVGSGTVHDATRFVAHARGILFLSVPTAASVDGFVSTVAAMTWYGYKKTTPAVAPLYVVADSAIFAKAPYRLTASGIADLLGKYTALADWRIAHRVTGEYLCERVCRLQEQAMQEVRRHLDDIVAGEESACESLMYGLLLSGLAMQMVGNSRPASGCEHHMSHLWEMEAINGHVDAYHGEKVGVGLVACAAIYHRLADAIRAGRVHVRPYPGVEQELLRDSFQKEEVYQQIVAENTPDPLEAVDPERLEEALPDIAALLDDVPPVADLKATLTRAHAVQTLPDLGLAEGLLTPSLRLSPYVRNRLTLMRLMKRLDFDL